MLNHSPNPNSRMPKSETNPKWKKTEPWLADIFPNRDSDISEENFWESATAEYNALHDGPDQRVPVRDLCERTAQFGEKIIRFAKKIPRNAVTSRLISQLVGAG